MTGATFPHSADIYKVLYGIEMLKDGKWVSVPFAMENFGPIGARALYERKDRDELLKDLQGQNKKGQYRKVTLHVVCNVIPERDSEEVGEAKAERRASA